MILRKALTIFLLLVCPSAASACGIERWAVKVLTDSDHTKIGTRALSKTVSNLRGEPAPSQVQVRAADDSRFAPVETHVVIVNAVLLRYRFETDGDFHLVIADPDNLQRTMIAEIPDPGCLSSNQRFAAAARDMRARLVNRFGSPRGHVVRLVPPTPIRIRGVPFFDIKHSRPQDGVAPNLIEIHPVLGVDLGR